MKKVKILIVLAFLLCVLQGCSSKNSELLQKEVDEYNSTVSKTLTSYAKTKLFIDKHRKEVDNLIMYDKKTKNVSSDAIEMLPKLNKQELEDFKDWGTLLTRDYFTAYGNTGIREVTVITGNKYDMYVTIVWAKDEVVSIERRLIERTKKGVY